MEILKMRWRQIGASRGVKGASKGGSGGGTGRQRGVTRGVMFEDDEWQSKCRGHPWIRDQIRREGIGLLFSYRFTILYLTVKAARSAEEMANAAGRCISRIPASEQSLLSNSQLFKMHIRHKFLAVSLDAQRHL
ncbi:hypothetical protein B0H14DRAFT_2577895 [Mycena olivaceomarginata]|nr:hypothetical protein B0H14DRAFT_2577895 [Mycena olivaceomarginata]